MEKNKQHIFLRNNCLLDIQSDGPLLADTHFGAFYQKTLWFVEIRPQDTVTRLQPVEERVSSGKMSYSSLLNWLQPARGVLWPNFTEPECLLTKCYKVGVRQQRTITLDVQHSIVPFFNGTHVILSCYKGGGRFNRAVDSCIMKMD